MRERERERERESAQVRVTEREKGGRRKRGSAGIRSLETKEVD